jgi:hypothetical protein
VGLALRNIRDSSQLMPIWQAADFAAALGQFISEA